MLPSTDGGWGVACLVGDLRRGGDLCGPERLDGSGVVPCCLVKLKLVGTAAALWWLLPPRGVRAAAWLEVEGSGGATPSPCEALAWRDRPGGEPIGRRDRPVGECRTSLGTSVDLQQSGGHGCVSHQRHHQHQHHHQQHAAGEFT